MHNWADSLTCTDNMEKSTKTLNVVTSSLFIWMFEGRQTYLIDQKNIYVCTKKENLLIIWPFYSNLLLYRINLSHSLQALLGHRSPDNHGPELGWKKDGHQIYQSANKRRSDFCHQTSKWQQREEVKTSRSPWSSRHWGEIYLICRLNSDGIT